MEKAIKNNKKDIIRLKERIKDFENIREKIQKNFDFLIPNYIIDDIAIGESYRHICLMINLAKINNKLTSKNAIELKRKIKDYIIKN